MVPLFISDTADVLQATSVEEDCSNPEWDLEDRDFQGESMYKIDMTT